MGMKTIKQRIKNEVEYLQALAEMYEHEENFAANAAAIAALEALQHLRNTLDEQAGGTTDQLPVAA